MIIKYQPKHEAFQGTVDIDVPGYLERIQLIKQLKYKPAPSQDESGVEVVTTDSDLEKLYRIEQMLALVAKYVKSMDLEHKESGIKFESLEALEMYEEYSEIIGELGALILNGLKLGKASGKP